MEQEKSAGVIPYMYSKFLLVQHTKEAGGHLDFPKGHIDPAESEEECAKREAMEEAGVSVEIVPGFREEIVYSPKPGVSKKVVFFVGKVYDMKPSKDDRIQSFTWTTYERALDKLTYDSAKEILRKAGKFLKI